MSLDDIRRYNASELEDALDLFGVDDPGQPAREPSGASEGLNIQLSADLKPPPEKLLVLVENSAQFAATYRGERKDLPSQSEYDLALASMALNAGWSEQEAVALIVAHRRKRGEKPKLRLGYYERTIGKARSKKAEDQAEDFLRDAASSGSGSDPLDGDRRKQLLQNLSTRLGIKIRRIVRYKGDPPEYRLILDDGEIDLGGISTITSTRGFLNAVAAACGTMIPRLPQARWDPIAQVILRACEPGDLGPDSSPAKLVADMLQDFLETNPVFEDRDEAIAQKAPFRDEKGLWLFLQPLIEWLRNYHGERYTRRRLGRLLHVAGCTTHPVKWTPKGGRETTRSAWRCPAGIAEIANRGKSRGEDTTR